jgi:hypothetical protein
MVGPKEIIHSMDVPQAVLKISLLLGPVCTAANDIVVIDDDLPSALPTERVVSPSNQTGLTDKDVERAIAILTGTL